jgi:hypothetical protein
MILMIEETETKNISLNFRETQLEIGSTDAVYQKLFDFGNRIATLSKKPQIGSDSNSVALLDDLLGAVYCLILAKHHNFVNRTGQKIEDDKVLKRADDIAASRVRIDGAWIAGWHFNSALFRVSAVYHRSLKLIDGNPNQKNWAKNILPRVKTSYKTWTGTDWSETSTHAIHDEVNVLKHDGRGIYQNRTATFEDTVASISELLELIEVWSESLNLTP